MTPLITYIITIAYLMLVLSTVLLILTDNSNPSKTVAWIIVIMLIPFAGLILYYVFGYNQRRDGRCRENYLKFRDEFFSNASPELGARLRALRSDHRVRPGYESLIRLLWNSDDALPVAGSRVEIITSGQRKLDALIEDIRAARHHIHFEYFYFRRDEDSRMIRELLMQKAREGVRVRFIYENVANIDISPRYYTRMREAGVEVLAFSKRGLPWIRRHLNYRDHRKVVVIDGHIGYTGGMNIGKSYFKEWRDTHLRIEGNGAAGLQYSFLRVWYESGGTLPDELEPYFPPMSEYTGNLLQVVPEAPDSRWPFLLMANVWVAQNARKYLYIQTPYFMPSDTLLEALKSAALSGVDVRLMVSRKSDIFFMDPATRSFYEETLRSGIRIYELEGLFSHAKSMVADDYLSVIGSANMDSRSLELSFEINTYIYDAELAACNRAIFFEDMRRCREVSLEEWLRRPWHHKLGQSVMRLFSPLL